MSDIKFLPYTWKEFHRTCFEFSQQILQSGKKFDRIASISRGGMVVSRLLSDYLQLPISNFTIVTYASIAEAGEPKIVEELGVAIDNERILLVDEIVDSGITLEVAIKYLSSLNPHSIMTAVPFFKPNASFVPDFWQVKTDKWVVFPYEVRETIIDLNKVLQKKGKSVGEIKEQLLQFGFDLDQIEMYL